MKIGIIGGGKWGSALHFALSKNHTTLLWSRNKKEIQGFSSLEEVLTCKYLILALPAQVLRGWLEQNFIFKEQKILVAAKGIEVQTGAFLNEVLGDYAQESHLAFLSGPSFAAEVMQSLPTAVVINATNEKFALEFASFFPNFIKTYISNDVIGAEICGAYKNVLAIASGICSGLKLGNNARASLIARGLVEMRRFGTYFGAKDETFLGLSGAGDLFLTASSTLSRNYRVGLKLAKEEGLKKILEDLGEVAEGVYTAKAIQKISDKHNIYTPIATEVERMLHGKKPTDSLKDLLSSS